MLSLFPFSRESFASIWSKSETALCLNSTLSLCAPSRPLYRAVARIIALRPVPHAKKLHHHYWWPAHNSNGDETAAASNQADSSQAKASGASELSPLVRYRSSQRSTVDVPRRIYILGAGGIGGFVAHSLASLPQPPPITLLLSTRQRLSDWYEQGQSVKLTTHGMLDTKSNIDAEDIRPPKPTPELASAELASATNSPLSLSASSNCPQDGIIHNLIVSVKAFSTVGALMKVAHRLTPESSILFLQNGMGIIEEVNERVFPDPTQRPQYMLGVISHGVYTTKPFALVHSGAGTIALAILPRNIEEVKPHFVPSALYLLRTLTRSPVLAAVGFAPTDLLQLQIEKIAINAIINPLTALMDCLNGDLLHRPSISRVMRLLLAEISLVIKSLPELQGVPNVKMRFDIKRLEGQVIRIATKTAANRSSMLQDIRRGQQTEIEYLTGYLVRRGEEVGIQCVMNFMIKHMVKAKEGMERERHGHLLPIEPRNFH